jgi:hypothetical protein
MREPAKGHLRPAGIVHAQEEHGGLAASRLDSGVRKGLQALMREAFRADDEPIPDGCRGRKFGFVSAAPYARLDDLAEETCLDHAWVPIWTASHGLPSGGVYDKSSSLTSSTVIAWKIAVAAMSIRLATSALRWPNSCTPSNLRVLRSPVTRIVMRWLPG